MFPTVAAPEKTLYLNTKPSQELLPVAENEELMAVPPRAFELQMPQAHPGCAGPPAAVTLPVNLRLGNGICLLRPVSLMDVLGSSH